MTQNAVIKGAATVKLRTPILLSILVLSSVTAFADVCPESTEKVTLQESNSGQGQLITCSYVGSDGKEVTVKKGASSATNKLNLPPLEITPVDGSAWNIDASGTKLICDNLKSACEFSVDNPVLQDMDRYRNAMTKLHNLSEQFVRFFPLLANETKLYENLGVKLGVSVTTAPLTETLYELNAKFGTSTDGSVAEDGKLFTFEASKTGYSEAITMANNLKLKSGNVIKNTDGTYSVVVDMSSITGILPILNKANDTQIKNGGYLYQNEYNDMAAAIDAHKMAFDDMVYDAFSFLAQP